METHTRYVSGIQGIFRPVFLTPVLVTGLFSHLSIQFLNNEFPHQRKAEARSGQYTRSSSSSLWYTEQMTCGLPILFVPDRTVVDQVELKKKRVCTPPTIFTPVFVAAPGATTCAKASAR